jgi:hypothetical protein
MPLTMSTGIALRTRSMSWRKYNLLIYILRLPEVDPDAASAY